MAISCLGLLCVALHPAGAAEPVHLVRDINDTAIVESSAPSSLTTVGDLVFFGADDGVFGRELWRSDGTAAGTFRLTDMAPNSVQQLDPVLNARVGDRLWVHPRVSEGLWSTDGTVAGTMPAADAPPYQPTFASEPIDGVTYYFDDDGTHGTELWRSDGTADGTYQVADINPVGGVRPQHAPIAVGPYVLFVVDDGRHGAELWRSDGTAAGTLLLRDIADGSADGIPGATTEIVSTGTRAVFSAFARPATATLWRSDGTVNGTRQVWDRALGNPSMPRQLTIRDTTVFFTGLDVDAGYELWRLDDAQTKPSLVADIQPGPGSGDPFDLRAVGETLFFRANDGVHGIEPWRSDGSAAGTALVADIAPGVESSVCPITGFNDTAALGDGYLFVAGEDPGNASCSLWRADATGAAPQALTALRFERQSGLVDRSLARLGDRVLFANSDQPRNRELWITDGTPAGTHMLADLRDRNTGSAPRYMCAGEFGVVFIADDSVGPAQLWRSDGTRDGTVPLFAPVNQIRPTDPPACLAIGGSAVFAARDGDDLWLWRGGAHGSERLQRLGKDFDGFIPFDHRAFFRSDDNLWASDGSVAGTRFVKPLTPPRRNSGWAVRDGLLYFASDSSLVRSDGTAAGTAPIWTAPPGFGPPAEITAAGPFIYFAGSHAVAGYELWRSDGSAGGTELVADIRPGSLDGIPNPSLPVSLTAIGERLFFFADDGVHGAELWQTDGTTPGTRMVADILPGPEGSAMDKRPAALATDDLLVFVARSREGSDELWRSDGSAGGTSRLLRLEPSGLTPIAGGLLFLAAGDLWRSDGSAAGTTRVLSQRTQGGSLLTPLDVPLAIAAGALYFAASDGRTGYELWTARLAAVLCAGDLDADRRVAIDELVRGVGAALGSVPIDAVAAFDADTDGRVSIAELISAVANATDGCTA